MSSVHISVKKRFKCTATDTACTLIKSNNFTENLQYNRSLNTIPIHMLNYYMISEANQLYKKYLMSYSDKQNSNTLIEWSVQP